MKNSIIVEQQSGEHIININWNGKMPQQLMDLSGIEVLYKFMLQDKGHDKDLLFFPLINLIKNYLQYPLDFDVPTELEEEIKQMQEIIKEIEEKYVAKERIDINFKNFVQLLEAITAKIEGLQNMRENEHYNY